MLSLSHETCVRTRTGAASCTACIAACPTRAIGLDGDRRAVVVDLSKCTGCGLCQAECPSDSFSGAFDPAAFSARAGLEIRCGESGLPCVGAVCAEDLAAMAHRRGRLTVVAAECAWAATGHLLAERHLGEAQRLLQAIGSPATLTFVPGARLPAPDVAPEAAVEPSLGRRRLLGLVFPLSSADRLVPPRRLEPRRLHQPPPTARRKRLLASFGSSFEAPEAELPAAALPCASPKALNEDTCTGCLACVSACPTGALTVTRSSQLRFDLSRCVNCSACHQACEPGALTRASTVSPAELLELSPRALGSWRDARTIGVER